MKNERLETKRGIRCGFAAREHYLSGLPGLLIVKATKEKGEELLQRGKAVAQRVFESAVEEARQQGLRQRPSVRRSEESFPRARLQFSFREPSSTKGKGGGDRRKGAVSTAT
jgi:hypothetical protein